MTRINSPKETPIAVGSLPLVDAFLYSLSQKLDKKEENRNAILALASAWLDMIENDL